MKPFPILLLVFAILMSSCVGSKKYKLQKVKNEDLNNKMENLSADLSNCIIEKDKQRAKIASLEAELANAKGNNTVLLNQLASLSVITEAQSESIKKSLENINTKDAYIKDLQSAMARKDSLNMRLVLSLKGALQDVNDQDVEINVEGSAVFISVSDKLLFKSGSYEITARAKEVLGKVAQVLKSQPELQFMVEGHTDNKPINTGFIKDNWDLSVLRSTAVVRTLQKDFGLDPSRMIAAGRSEYLPLKSNDTNDDRALNRRTRIMVLPQLDQFFKLLESKN